MQTTPPRPPNIAGTCASCIGTILLVFLMLVAAGMALQHKETLDRAGGAASGSTRLPVAGTPEWMENGRVVTCNRCGGSGMAYDASGHLVTCPVCSGKGRLRNY